MKQSIEHISSSDRESIVVWWSITYRMDQHLYVYINISMLIKLIIIIISGISCFLSIRTSLIRAYHVRNHATKGGLVHGEAWTADGKEIFS
jgi:hypothetical protein